MIDPNKPYYVVRSAGIDIAIDLGHTTVELEELPFSIVASIGEVEWEERHPLYGQPNCPEPGTVTKRKRGVQAVWLAVKMSSIVAEAQKAKGNRDIVRIGQEYYKRLADISEEFDELDWNKLEEEIA